MKKTGTRNVLRRTVALCLCAAVFAVMGFACFGADAAAETVKSGIDWGNGVTTAMVLEWAAYIGGCVAAIFLIAGAAVLLVLEKKK